MLMFVHEGALQAQVPEMVLPELKEGEHMIFFDSLLRPVDESQKQVFICSPIFT
jgi:hypothetical protein